MDRNDFSLKLAKGIAEKTDAALKAILDKIGGDVSEMVSQGRLAMCVWPDGSVSYQLDGKDIFTLGPLEVSTTTTPDGYTATVTRLASQP